MNGGSLGQTYLFLVVQALVVVLEHGQAFRFAGVVFRRCVSYVAGEDFLPEGEAAGGACWVRISARFFPYIEGCNEVGSFVERSAMR